jgi:large subunit ribosomal protein L6
MSRIGKLPITIPAGVTITVSPENVVTVKGPKGELTQAVDPLISVNVEGNVCTVTRPNDEKEARSKHGLYRALINNMVFGCSEGYKKILDGLIMSNAG